MDEIYDPDRLKDGALAGLKQLTKLVTATWNPYSSQIASEGARGRAGNSFSSHPAVQWVGLEEIGLSGAMK